MNIQKESTTKLKDVPETLMITLYGRYTEQGYPDCILQDKKAVEIAEKVDYDFSKYADGWASRLASVIRAKTIDDLLIKFLTNHPQATIINLGGGLCTRFFRIDNGEINWYDIDFPEVIELKQKLVTQRERYNFVPSSILEPAWFSKINLAENQPLFIIMEGVSMYLTEEENKFLFQQIQTMLAPKYAPIEMVFDVMNRKSAGQTKRHDTVSKTTAKFKWGIDNSQEIETWDLGITLKDELFYLSEFAKYPQRMKPWWLKYISFILMPIFKHSGRILQIQINK
ncbi:MAG: class I SAM-dependent methyltransferase [Cyanobacteria bacterium J06639_18]